MESSRMAGRMIAIDARHQPEIDLRDAAPGVARRALATLGDERGANASSSSAGRCGRTTTRRRPIRIDGAVRADLRQRRRGSRRRAAAARHRSTAGSPNASMRRRKANRERRPWPRRCRTSVCPTRRRFGGELRAAQSRADVSGHDDVDAARGLSGRAPEELRCSVGLVAADAEDEGTRRQRHARSPGRPGERVVGAVVRDADSFGRGDAVRDQVLARERRDGGDEARAAPEHRQHEAVDQADAAAMAGRHDPAVEIVNADDLAGNGDGCQVAEAHEPAAHVARQLRLDPELRNPRLVELRHALGRDAPQARKDGRRGTSVARGPRERVASQARHRARRGLHAPSARRRSDEPEKSPLRVQTPQTPRVSAFAGAACSRMFCERAENLAAKRSAENAARLQTVCGGRGRVSLEGRAASRLAAVLCRSKRRRSRRLRERAPCRSPRTNAISGTAVRSARRCRSPRSRRRQRWARAPSARSHGARKPERQVRRQAAQLFRLLAAETSRRRAGIR